MPRAPVLKETADMAREEKRYLRLRRGQAVALS